MIINNIYYNVLKEIRYEKGRINWTIIQGCGATYLRINQENRIINITQVYEIIESPLNLSEVTISILHEVYNYMSENNREIKINNLLKGVDRNSYFLYA